MPSIHDRGLANNDVFKLVFVGQFFGWGALFLASIAFILARALLDTPQSVLAIAPWTSSLGLSELSEGLLFVVALPAALALQGVLISAVTVLGVVIHRRVKSGWPRAARPAA